jgi:large subunit ribosomal protein L3
MQLKEGRRTGALAMKVGMLSVWDRWGERHAVTVLQLDQCQVVSVKTVETNGYTALQLGVGEAKANGKRMLPSLRNQFLRKGLYPSRQLLECRVTPDTLLPVGFKIRAQHFVAGQVICAFSFCTLLMLSLVGRC